MLAWKAGKKEGKEEMGGERGIIGDQMYESYINILQSIAYNFVKVLRVERH